MPMVNSHQKKDEPRRHGDTEKDTEKNYPFPPSDLRVSVSPWFKSSSSFGEVGDVEAAVSVDAIARVQRRGELGVVAQQRAEGPGRAAVCNRQVVEVAHL